MLEIDILADLESLIGWKAYPIKIPQNATYPAIVYKELNNTRNDESSLSGNELRNLRYEIVLVADDSESIITNKAKLLERYEGFSGMLGNTNIFISRIFSSVPFFDNAQQNFEYNITVEFTVKT